MYESFFAKHQKVPMMFMISNLQLKTPISAMCHIRHEKKPPSESCLLRFVLLFPMSYIQCLIFLDDHSSQRFFWSLLVVPLSVKAIQQSFYGSYPTPYLCLDGAGDAAHVGSL